MGAEENETSVGLGISRGHYTESQQLGIVDNMNLGQIAEAKIDVGTITYE